MVKLYFNKGLSISSMLNNFELRGYKKAGEQPENTSFIKLITPGKTQQEIIIYYNNVNEYFWTNLSNNEHSRFLGSRDVDFEKSTNFPTREISTQTE